MKWWVTEAGNQPIGPVTTDLILRGIEAGKVPLVALVCEVGGNAWRPLTEVDPFAEAARRASRARRFDESERTLVDADLSPADLEDTLSIRRAENYSEHTIVDASPLPSSPVSSQQANTGTIPPSRFEEGEDRTIVERNPRLPTS
jgi:hypothetical protein